MKIKRTPTLKAALVASFVLAIHSPAFSEVTEATTPAGATTPAAATHTLFMGVELAVQRDSTMLPVRDVQGSSIIAKRKGKEIRIPTTGKSLNLKVVRSLKVAAQSATLHKLEVERTYTRENDPLHKFANEAGAVAGEEAVASMQLGKLTDAIASQGFAEIAAANSEGHVDVAGPAARVDRAFQDYSRATFQAQSGAKSAGEAASDLQGDLAAGAYDALWISFKVSAPKPLQQAYVVILAQLRSGGKNDGRQYNWVYAKALGLVDERPQPVYIKQGGFPPGYVLDRCEIHLFNAGEEIVTNESPMRVELSRDEAFQYSAIEYIAARKDVTAPADLAGGQNTEVLRMHLEQNYRGGPIYVGVAKEGLATGIFRDKTGETPIADAELLEIVRNLRFNPALVGGKPRDSVVKVMATADSA